MFVPCLLFCFGTESSNNLQCKTELDKCMIHKFIPAFRNAIGHNKRTSPTETRTHTGAERHTHTLGVWGGPQQGTPCTQLVPSCLATSDFLQSGSTSQPSHCKLSTWKESWLLLQRHQPTCDSSSLTSFFTACAWATTGTNTGAILARDRYRFMFHTLTKFVCCFILSSHQHTWIEMYCNPETCLFEVTLKVNTRTYILTHMTDLGSIFTSLWLRVLSP